MTSHVALPELLAYYLGESSTDEDDAVEAHVFECTACGDALDGLHRTASAIVGLVRSAQLAAGGTGALLNRLSRDRMMVRHYTLLPGETVQCTIGPHDDFLAGRFVLPPGDHPRIDLRVLDQAGQELMRLPDIPVDVRARQAILFLPARPSHDEPSSLQHYVFVVPEGDGDREIARYGLDHTAMREP